MAKVFHSKWLEISGGPSCGTDKSDKRTFGTSGTSISRAPRNYTGPNIDDPATWPPYMVRFFDAATAEGGEELARRQIEAELAFWRHAEEQGWRQMTTDSRRDAENPESSLTGCRGQQEEALDTPFTTKAGDGPGGNHGAEND